MAIGSQAWAQEYAGQVGNMCFDKAGHSWHAQIISPNYSICRSADFGKLAQDPPIASVPAPLHPYQWPGPNPPLLTNPDTNSVRAITLPEGIVVETCGTDGRGTPISGGVGCIELSPDQKLARAFALCQRNSIRHVTDATSFSVTHSTGVFAFPSDQQCASIALAWLGKDDSDADRTFIESVAKDLPK